LRTKSSNPPPSSGEIKSRANPTSRERDVDDPRTVEQSKLRTELYWPIGRAE